MDQAAGDISRWEALFPDQPGPRRRQVQVLSELAGPGRRVVEIGVWIGYSAIGMALSGAEVTGVDPYIPHQGWADESYRGDVDLAQFVQNCEAAGVNIPIVRMTAVEAGLAWQRGPVDLVHWDLDLGHTLAADFGAWERHIKPDGWFVFHDLPGQRFGSGPVIQRAVASGRWRAPMAWVDANLWGMIRR